MVRVHGRRRKPQITDELTERIDAAMAEVEAAKESLLELIRQGSSTSDRRAGYVRLDRAYRDADGPLREAVVIAKQRSYGEWIERRRFLSVLGTEYQQFLFAGRDDPKLGGPARIGVDDTAMSWSEGDHKHAESLARTFRAHGEARAAIG